GRSTGASVRAMPGGAPAPALPAASATAAGESTIVAAPSAPGIGAIGLDATSVVTATGFGDTAARSGFAGAAAGFRATIVAASAWWRGLTIVASGGGGLPRTGRPERVRGTD